MDFSPSRFPYNSIYYYYWRYYPTILLAFLVLILSGLLGCTTANKPLETDAAWRAAQVQMVFFELRAHPENFSQEKPTSALVSSWNKDLRIKDNTILQKQLWEKGKEVYRHAQGI